MAGFDSYDDIIAEVTANGKLLTFDFFKTGPTGEAAGVWHSLWPANGMPGAGAEQTTAIAVTAGADNGSGLIRLTITSNTSLATGDTVVISGITGTGGFDTASNGARTVTVINSTTIDLQGTTFVGTYSSGGVVYETFTYTNAAGSINFANQSPDQKHLFTFGATATQDCVLMLYDRLVMTSGINIATTGNKTITSLTLPRYSGTSSVGVEAWLEINTTVTANTPVVTLSSYTDSDGNTVTTAPSVTLAATPLVRSMYQLPLATDDLGLRAVETLNVGTAGTSGVANVSLIKPLAYLPLQQNQWNERDFVLQLTSLPRLFDGASLGLAYLATTATAPNFWGCVRFGYG